jgi:hypothetical protein
MRLEKLRDLFWPAAIAIVFSTLGWFGMPERPVVYADAIPGVKIIEVLFAMPGGFVAAAVASVFSPQGGHGIDRFLWIAFPSNLVIYFGLFTALFSRRRGRQTKLISGSPGSKP